MIVFLRNTIRKKKRIVDIKAMDTTTGNITRSTERVKGTVGMTLTAQAQVLAPVTECLNGC